MAAGPKRVLVLAGQREAAPLVARIAARALVSVALEPHLGELARGDLPPGCDIRAPARSAAALMTALKWDRIQAVVDAGDPFADQASRDAATACRALGAPLIQLRRPGLPDAALGESAVRVEGVDAAPRALSPFARAFLQLPLDRLPAFMARPLAWYFIRTHRPPAGRFPFRRGDFAVGAPPFGLAHERILFADRRIDHLVIGDVGGDWARPTIEAARERAATIVAVSPPALPPPPPNGARVETVDAALDILTQY